MLTIGNLTLENNLVMAPMAGITNLPFRLMVKELGAGLVTTEMISAMGLTLKQKKTLSYLKSDPAERPLSVQIFGSAPEVMAEAADIVAGSGAGIIDINMGCPARKVTRTGAGASLLKDLKKIEKIVTSVRLATDLPLTVKIRTGWSQDEPVAVEVAHIIEDCGADGLTIHPRFASQGYSGQADWGVIMEVKEIIDIPVIGNGDIIDPSAALKMKEMTGCDGLMIGRAAVRNPWIFRQILEMEKGVKVQEPDLAERRNYIMRHFNLLADLMGEHRAAFHMRGLLLRYTKGLPKSSFFRENITRIKDLTSLVATMDSYFSTLKEGSV